MGISVAAPELGAATAARAAAGEGEAAWPLWCALGSSLAAAFGLALGATAIGRPAEAHVGSPDVVADGQAGPYHLLVTIRPPDVVPGIARIEVRALDADVARVSVVPLPVSGPGVSSPPVADVARPDPVDPRLYGSTLWLMRSGAWQVRLTVDGARGSGTLAIPVPALARAVRPMSPFLIALLLALLALLVTGAIAIVGASLREADLEAGQTADRRRLRRARVAMAVAAALLALAIFGGRGWWTDEAGLYRRLLYKPMQVEVTRPARDRLALALVDPGWLRWRRTDDLVPDHGHLLHLFLVRAPGLDAIAHLHPRAAGEARFSQSVPPLPDGSYRVFADLVHQSGLDETATTTLELTGAAGASASRDPGGDRFDPDDAAALIPRAATVAAPAYTFADGSGQLRWLDARAPHAGETVTLDLEAETPDGQPADIEPYMGMAGHAMIVARDFSVFAHIHPTGSVPMAALALVQGGSAMDHAHHHMSLGPRVRFPYVFPHAGAYRVFVQIKRSGRIETAAYDLDVLPKLPAR